MVADPQANQTSVFAENCPAQRLLARIADKWTTLIIYALSRHGTMRYSELQRSVGGISQKMLTQTLRRLEENGLIDRAVHPVVPPRVEYRLTSLGTSLIEPLKALCEWAEAHVPEMEANRERRDRARQSPPAQEVEGNHRGAGDSPG